MASTWIKFVLILCKCFLDVLWKFEELSGYGAYFCFFFFSVSIKCISKGWTEGISFHNENEGENNLEIGLF